MPELEKPETAAAGVREEILAEVWIYVASQLEAKFSIEHGEYTIGRDPSCHIPIDADQVSRHHARLTFTAYELVIEDLGSSNGVFIEGVQVQLPTRVRLDQEVQIGTAKLFIRLRDAAAQQFAAALWDSDLGLGPVREQLEGKKYKVITTINRGGMGVILQARDLRIRRTVAMKVMKTSTQFARESVLRFIDEAQLTGQLEHPNIVPVYQLGIDDQGESFYTMKFVKGITLDDVLRGIRNGNERIIAKYPLGTLLTIFQKVCDGVAYAHSKGVVHRDLKPENIMIGSFGEVLVMDWGLAKNITGGRSDAPAQNPPDLVQLAAVHRGDLRGFETMNGLIVGTPPYISPEQARGELDRVDARSDVWVLGAILYAILTLRPPVEAGTITEVVEKILTSRIDPPSSFNTPVKSSRHAKADPADLTLPIVFAHCPGRRIPDGLSAVTMKALALDQLDRYQKVEDLQTDIAAFQSGFAPKAERASPLKHALLWAGRHKKEVGIFAFFFLLFNASVVAFFLQLNAEKNRAQLSAKRAVEYSKLADLRLEELRGTAPTFAAEARQLMENGSFGDALERIDYAIAQVPNEADYHNLRGNILQVLLQFEEAREAYETALARNPQLAAAKVNLDLTRQTIEKIGAGGQVTADDLEALHDALVRQGRVSGARTLERQFQIDAPRPARPPNFPGRRTARLPRFETNPDGTLTVDFTRVMQPDLGSLRGQPVSTLTLDETRLLDFEGLRGLPLETLSASRTLIQDLAPLAGMSLRSLSIDSTPVADLSPLRGLPIETLRASNTVVSDLTPLRGLPLQSLNLGRSGVSDLTPLAQLPLRELNLEGCAKITDLKPLLEIVTLESVLLPAQCQDIEFLRAHPNLKRISYKRITQSAAEFWREFDATKNAPTKKPAPNP